MLRGTVLLLSGLGLVERARGLCGRARAAGLTGSVRQDTGDGILNGSESVFSITPSGRPLSVSGDCGRPIKYRSLKSDDMMLTKRYTNG